MFGVAFDEIFFLMKKYFPFVNWDLLTNLIAILCIIFVIIDTLLAILIWLPSYILQSRLWHIYYLLTGNSEEAEKCEKGRCHIVTFGTIQVGFIVCFGFLLTSMALSIVFVVVSVAVVGLSYGFSETCFATVAPLDGKYNMLLKTLLSGLSCASRVVRI